MAKEEQTDNYWPPPAMSLPRSLEQHPGFDFLTCLECQHTWSVAGDVPPTELKCPKCGKAIIDSIVDFQPAGAPMEPHVIPFLIPADGSPSTPVIPIPDLDTKFLDELHRRRDAIKRGFLEKGYVQFDEDTFVKPPSQCIKDGGNFCGQRECMFGCNWSGIPEKK